MRFLKEKKSIIISFIIGVIIASSITVYATGYLASQVTYKDDKTVEYALNDLYLKAKTLDNCIYFEFDHEANTQFEYDFEFVPSKILAFFSVPNGENIFITYNISKNSIWALGSNGNRNRMGCYILF